MKVTAIAFVYNEIDYLPLAVEYYKAEGCDLYIIDNMSTDGTWEWLQANNIPSHRFDTMEAFQLEWLQGEMIKTLHQLNPDWFVWFAPDMFHIFSSSILSTLTAASDNGYNQILSPCYSFKNTGEIPAMPMPLYYRYAFKTDRVLFCSKYDKDLSIFADTITIPNSNVLQIGNIFEYGGCKPKEIQEEKLKRRQKAWKWGTPEGHGQHYVTGKKKNWIENPALLTDVWNDASLAFYVNKLRDFIKTQEK